MRNIRKFLTLSVEYYIIVIVLLAGFTPPYFINPVAIALIAILVLQLIFKNKIGGLIVAISFALIHVYLLFALISEFNEVATTEASGIPLILVGLSIIIANLFASIVMIYKYVGNAEHEKFEVERDI
ncbi:hypothetical protein [Chryseosolibacter indicus]|nr:hypothetical protein [Chryseosolibacter indicus]